MLLDIGAKTSNLLFFEKGKVFSRSINLGANAITQDFANEAKLKFDDAEKIKIAEGFVSLGGAYEEPENPHQAAISKIARQFMTKLHIQVNQTMQFYRGQQGGSAPQRLFLSGGASLMPYTAQFFAEKLNVPVEYFNPFRNVHIDPSVNLEDLSRVAHSLGEVVGLGLRNLANCPVEMNLMPESTLRWQSFDQKKPYLLASVYSLVLVTFAVGFLFHRLGGNKQVQIDELNPKLEKLNDQATRFDAAYSKMQSAQSEASNITLMLQERYYWGDFLGQMRAALIRAEGDVKKQLAATRPGVESGIWVEQMSSAASLGSSSAAPPGVPTYPGAVPGGAPGGYVPPAGQMQPGMPPGAGMSAAAGGASTNTITLLCRAVSLTSVDSAANTKIAYAVENEIESCPMVDPKATQLSPNISPDDPNGTFTFTMNVTLLATDPLNPQNF